MVLLEKDKTFTFDELEINIERLEGFISNKEINDYILLNNILNLKKIDKNMIQNKNMIQIKENQNKFYCFEEKTKEKNLVEKEKEIRGKIDLLNENIDKILSENINKRINKIQKELSLLNKEAENINEQLKNIIKTYNLNLSSNDVSENISLINPVLYIKFEENKNKLIVLYSDLKSMKSLSENCNNIFNLELKEIKFKDSGLKSGLIIAIGIIFGLFAGMFLAVIKKPVIDILREIKEEK